jgi:hypothetical protein
MQLQSENRCTIIKEKYFRNMQSKDRCNKIKKKYFSSNNNLKTDASNCA